MIVPSTYLAAALDGGLLLVAGLYAAGIRWLASGIREQPAAGTGLPRVSVVVAARDEATRIGTCLAQLLGQDYPADLFEVIVVDDGSVDETARVVGVAVQRDPRVRLLSTEAELGRSGAKKAALSLGVGAATGEVILTTDADCLVPLTWMRSMVAAFRPEVGMVCGFSQIGEPGQARSFRQRYEALDFLGLMGCILGSVDRGHPMGASGQNLAYRREAFREIGGYERVKDRASGDDVLLLQLVRRFTRWRAAFATAPEARVVHPWSASWSALLRQRTRWASNAPCQLRLDPAFFGLMVAAFLLSLGLLAAPLLLIRGALDPWAVGLALVAKLGAEAVLLRRAAALFGRADLLSFFPGWALVQPLHVVVVGISGCLGVFTWKGRRHRWGRQR